MSGNKWFVWIGKAREVFKPGINRKFERGVPFEAPGLFEDLFEHDPMYVEVTDKQAEKILKDFEKAHSLKDPVKRWEAVEDLRTKVLKDLEAKAAKEIEKWRAWRNAHRKNLAVETAKASTPKDGDAK